MLKEIQNVTLALIFLPVLLLKNLPTLYLQTVLGVVVASYIYWPDVRWLIFPLCIIIAANFFKFMTDVISWL